MKPDEDFSFCPSVGDKLPVLAVTHCKQVDTGEAPFYWQWFFNDANSAVLETCQDCTKKLVHNPAYAQSWLKRHLLSRRLVWKEEQ